LLEARKRLVDGLRIADYVAASLAARRAGEHPCAQEGEAVMLIVLVIVLLLVFGGGGGYYFGRDGYDYRYGGGGIGLVLLIVLLLYLFGGLRF